jgi:PII-like signaling protein
MDGFQLTFYTEQDRRYGNKSLAEWLLMFAHKQGAQGGTIFGASESLGRDGRFHSAHFFELADQPVGVMIALDAPTCERLLDALSQEAIDVFYVKIPVEFGSIGAGFAR